MPLAAVVFLTVGITILYEVYDVELAKPTNGPSVSRVVGSDNTPVLMSVQFSAKPVLLSVLKIALLVP
jgi:4-hydroxybenzoate polyprenyltransferase